MLPVFESAIGQGNFSKVPVEQLLQEKSLKRTPGAGYARSTWTFDQDSFQCIERGSEEPCDTREAALYSYSLDVERICAERAFGHVLRDFEIEVASKVLDTSTISNAAVSGSAWSNNSSGLPVDDVIAALNAIRTNSGLDANAVVMDLSLFRHLQTSDQILDRIKYMGMNDAPASVNARALAQVFGVDEVIIAGGIKNTANEGQTASLSGIFDGTKCLVAKLPKSADLREPCLGRTFHFAGDGSSPAVTIESYRDESVRSTIYRARMDYDCKIILPAAGRIITGCA